MNKKIVIILVVILTLSLLHSVQVRKKEIRDYESFEKGTFIDAGLKDNGELFISLKSSLLRDPEKNFISAGTFRIPVISISEPVITHPCSGSGKTVL